MKSPQIEASELEESILHVDKTTGHCTAMGSLPVNDASNKMGENPSVDKSLAHGVGDGIREPHVGMVFESDEDAEKFYSEYGRCMGFSVRCNRSYKSKKDRTVISREFVCSKEGFRREKSNKRTLRSRQIVREGCMAMMIVRRRDCAKWYVVKFEKHHNHGLVNPNKVHFLRSHKHTSKPKSKLIDVSIKVGTSNGDNMNGLSNECSGPCDVGSIDKDCINTGTGQLCNVGIDAQIVLDYFRQMQSNNPAFFSAIQVNHKNCLSNVFWVDPRSRNAYSRFGDVVTFDTTYKKTKDQIPFVSFMGLNHHRQSILFGSALISDETEDTFVWLFETWLKAMSGEHPTTILTDLDNAIRAAVARAFPKSRHHFCRWNILRKFPEKLDANVGREFENCISNSETIQRFESTWESLLRKYNLKEKEWLQALYDDRELWVPVYLQDTFFAGMSSPQRSKSMNLFFEKYINANTPLDIFFNKYEKALEDRYEKEVEADYKASHTKLNLKTSSPMEKQVANLYTRTMFVRFQGEIDKSAMFAVNDNGDVRAHTYLVKQFDENTAHTVMFNSAELRANCSCMMFEFDGILCRHILALFRVKNIFTLPSHYILDRWARGTNKGARSIAEVVEKQVDVQESMTLRYNNLCLEAMKCADHGAKYKNVYNAALSAIREAMEKIFNENETNAVLSRGGSFVGGNNQDENFNASSKANSSANQGKIRDHMVTVTEGYRLDPSSYKHPMEEYNKTKRICGICKVAGHNSRSCKAKVVRTDSDTEQSDLGLWFIASQL